MVPELHLAIIFVSMAVLRQYIEQQDRPA